jgi:hypothetical protein
MIICVFIIDSPENLQCQFISWSSLGYSKYLGEWANALHGMYKSMSLIINNINYLTFVIICFH